MSGVNCADAYQISLLRYTYIHIYTPQGKVDPPTWVPRRWSQPRRIQPNPRGRGHTPTWVPKQRPHLDVFHPWSIPQEYLSSPPGDPGGDKTWILPPGHLGTQAAVAASPYPTSGYPRANGNRKKNIYMYTHVAVYLPLYTGDDFKQCVTVYLHRG